VANAIRSILIDIMSGLHTLGLDGLLDTCWCCSRPMQVRIVRHALEIVHLLTDQNPVQVVVDAIINRCVNRRLGCFAEGSGTPCIICFRLLERLDGDATETNRRDASHASQLRF